MKQIIQQGAEAIITLEDNNIHKNRVKKSYRLEELDKKLRKRRTKAEAKIINKLQGIIPVPRILETDDKENIIMEHIDGQKLSEHLESLNHPEICKQIAEIISKLHNQDIIHGDLTTSNMIHTKNEGPDVLNLSNTKINNLQNKREGDLSEDSKSKSDVVSDTNKGGGGKVFFIDFGLAFHSHKIEDKAVDLHLLKQALEAKHFSIAEQAIKIILENYKADQHKEIIERINTIEKRGRYRH